ncbi:MAG: peptidoglycan-binding domain-containing protein [Devosia sp.]
MKGLKSFISALVLLLLAAIPVAEGATVVFYSAPENTYGWCAGYSYSQSEACARAQCSDYGGTACDVAVECDGGWGATAFATDPTDGFGASCLYQRASGARATALMACIKASGTLCWTRSAFDTNGRMASEKSNLAFDYAWYAQGLLGMLGYDPGIIDGEMGNKTRTAIRAFETDLGLAPTGEANNQLVWRLLWAVQGGPALAGAMAEALAPEDNADYLFGAAALPYGTFSDDLLLLDEGIRREALATMLTMRGTKCTLPALSTQLVNGDPAAQTWNVGCAEGEFNVAIAGMTSVIKAGFTDTPAIPPPEVKPSPVYINAPPPNF